MEFLAQKEFESSNRWKTRYGAVYIATVAYFLFQVFNYYHPNFGYTPLAGFGNYFYDQSLPELKSTRHYTEPNSFGYDGQHYAQLALEPDAVGSDIERALDVYIYRARRILFSWTAYALGLGQPYWILQAYCIQNALFWCCIAILLLRWLPPTNGQNTLRFVAILYTAGLISSFNRALLDGPSLLLIMLGALLIEARRRGWGAATLGLAGLGKETNLLAIASLYPFGKKNNEERIRIVLQCSVAVLPFLLWYVYLTAASDSGQSGTLGHRNFDWPFFGYVRTVIAMIQSITENGFNATAGWQLLMLGSLLIQFVCLVAWPRPQNVWWRIGIVYAALMMFLGDAVWEDLGATPRTLLPLTLSFNLLFTRKPAALPIWALANSLTIVGFLSLQPPSIPDRWDLKGRSQQAYDPRIQDFAALTFEQGWYAEEKLRNQYWRWSSGSGVLSFDLPTDDPREALLTFTPVAPDDRDLSLSLNGAVIWHFTDARPQVVALRLKPGLNRLEFDSPQSPVTVGQDPRELSFALYNYQFELLDNQPSL